MLIHLLVSLCIGAFNGFAANKIMKGDSSGFLRNALLGIVGGLVGGFLGNLIGIGDGWISGIILAIAGSCLVIWVVRKIAK
ncbi:MAG: GlsB/YeaQ/YmgE family stress response membrane protein [Clostridia bacterium]|nr:GlsB/YeaQ/YmgE family stress response membrane protein [Clostridia bacterium]